jgi:hypothetical protein
MTTPAAIIAAAILVAISASTALAVSANTNVNLVILSYAVFQSPDPSSVQVTITKNKSPATYYVGGTIRCNYSLTVSASLTPPTDTPPRDLHMDDCHRSYFCAGWYQQGLRRLGVGVPGQNNRDLRQRRELVPVHLFGSECPDERQATVRKAHDHALGGVGSQRKDGQ